MRGFWVSLADRIETELDAKLLHRLHAGHCRS
jgi:hypothetical protein